MSKSLKGHVLSIAKNRDTEYICSLKDKFLDIVKEGILVQKKSKLELLYFDTCYCVEIDWNIIFDSFESRQEFIYVGNLLGFFIYEPNPIIGEWRIDVPEHIKGKKRTEAQKMFYQHNMEVRKIIKSEKILARKAAREVFEKLNKGDFESHKFLDSDDTYKIRVNFDQVPRPVTSIFKGEVKRIFNAKKFVDLHIAEDFWSFKIIDNKKS